MKKLISIIAALSATICATAQTAEYDSLRNHTWSVYGQGGVSFATGGDLISNVDESRGTVVAPMVGGGVSYTFNPWLRVSANYTFSKYKREQRYSALQKDGLAYRQFRTWYHNVDATAEFNVLELWKNRHNKRLNIWVGTGFGGMFVKGPDYSINLWQETKEDVQDGSSNYEAKGGLTAHTNRVKSESFYIPAKLNIEYDLIPQVTVGIKAQTEFLLKKRDYLPFMTEAVGLSIRYNFVSTKWRTKVKRLEVIEPMYADLLARYAADTQRYQNEIDDLSKQLKDCNDRNEDLQNALDQCQTSRRGLLNIIGNRTVYFDLDKYNIRPDAQKTIDELTELAKVDPLIRFSLVGSCDARGSSEYNMTLSENRAKAVSEALQSQGVSPEQIEKLSWIGKEGMTYDPKCRRVVVALE